MICRMWHGWTTPANANAYEQLLRSEIFRGIAARGIPDVAHFEVPHPRARPNEGG